MTTIITFETIDDLTKELHRLEKVYGEVVIPEYQINWIENSIYYPDGDPLDYPYARKVLRGDYD